MIAIVSPVALLLLAGSATALTARRWGRLVALMRSARGKDPRRGDAGRRLGGFLVYIVAQARMLRWPYSGVLHLFIFYGFVLLLTAIVQGMLEALFLGFRFDEVPLNGALALSQDLFSVLVITGCVMALINRLVVRPIRFRGSHTGDAVLILVWISGLLLAMQLNYVTRIAEGRPPEAIAHWRPFASAVARLFAPLGARSEALVVLHGVFFWSHLILVFGFLVYLGYSKHLHIVTATPNVIFRNLRPKGALPTLDIEALMEEEEPHFGVSTLEQFSWKDMLDLYTCTECGRCQTHCPAFNTGKVLSPKTLITDLRDYSYENLAGGYAATTHEVRSEGTGMDDATLHAPGGVATDGGGAHQTGGNETDHGGAEGGPATPPTKREVPGLFQPSWLTVAQVEGAVAANQGQRPLFGGVINEETLWACTTCGACVDQCPVLIDHVPKIISMRRALVLEESRIPRQAETALRGIENQANPYALSNTTRGDWARDLGVQFARDKPDAEYLYWVGCAASFDDRAKTIATALVTILQAGGVDFAILGNEEKCNGDPARRLGNEYLFQERAKENVATLRHYNVRKIIASCPHCFNTFANEYGDFGGDYEVIHHTQMIDRLLKDGRISMDETKQQQETITYHDSCYLGRWNDIFAPPRDILERIPGLTVVEMKRSKSEGMCCGAGGGRMWMEEGQPRVNHRRVEEAADTVGTGKVATACPFCLSMFDEGIASQQLESRVQVDDVAVYVARSLRTGPGVASPPQLTTAATQPGSADAAPERSATAPKAITDQPYGAGGARAVDESEHS